MSPTNAILIENSHCFARFHIVLQGGHIVLHEGHIVLQGDHIVLQGDSIVLQGNDNVRPNSGFPIFSRTFDGFAFCSSCLIHMFHVIQIDSPESIQILIKMLKGSSKK